MRFLGKIYYQKTRFYAFLILPLVRVKKFSHQLYYFFIQIIWAELVRGKTNKNEVFNLFIFLLFSILSLIAYHLQDFQEIIIILFIAIWYVDYWLAKNQFINGKQTIVTLDANSDQVVWQMPLLIGKPGSSEFSATEVKEISLAGRQVRGGAFQETVGAVWQVEISLWNGATFLLCEYINIVFYY